MLVASLIPSLSTITLQGPALPPPTAWASWLSIIANATKVAEVFVVMYGVWKYVAGRAERRAAEQAAAQLARKAANYEAWQVLNSAHGKGGSGGRVDALRDLKSNGVSLAGVHLDGAWLVGADLSEAQLAFATCTKTNLKGAMLERADLEGADLTGAILVAAKLSGAFLKDAVLSDAQLSTVDLRGADLTGIRGWERIRSISYARIDGVRNAPTGFRQWALERGATDGEPEIEPEMEEGFSRSWRAV